MRPRGRIRPAAVLGHWPGRREAASQAQTVRLLRALHADIRVVMDRVSVLEPRTAPDLQRLFAKVWSVHRDGAWTLSDLRASGLIGEHVDARRLGQDLARLCADGKGLVSRWRLKRLSTAKDGRLWCLEER